MSVRGERVIYREREREVDYEEPQRKSYTTVKRYQVPDRDNKSAIFDAEEVKEDKIVIRRERRDDGHGARSEFDTRSERFTERDRDYGRRDDRRDDLDIKITERVTDRDRRDSDRRDVTYRVMERESDRDRDRFSGSGRGEYRVVEREREVTRAPSPPVEERVREFRFERERDYSPARTAREERPYDLERYSKSTEYYAQPQPQPIIFRESAPQPIIIREERREPQQIIIRREEPQYEIIEREEVREDRQLVRQESPPPPATSVKSVVKSSVHSNVQKPEDEEYFYERRIREIDRGPRRREEEIRPSDSASQYSDDSYEYVRRERYVEGDRDRSPHHKLHLAEGALAGAGAAEIFRQHRKSQGRDSGHRGRDLLGGAALGAIAAEGISRAKSMRGTSRRRGSWDDDRRSRRARSRSRSRSRSQSKSRAKQLGGLAAIAAVGALAGYALKKGGSNKETVIINEGRPHRSRSRRRRGSYDAIEDVQRSDTAMDPAHRNRRIAQAGLASAAAAGIWERFRSKSRGGRERSKSRIRTAAPIIGAGLGGAALAGLYERNKASKEATKEAIIEDERNRGRRPSRSRSRSRSMAALGDRRRHDDGGMVAYGNDPIYPDGARGNAYYSDEEPGMYQRRHRPGSPGDSPDTRRRSQSRGRGFAEAGLAGAAAGHEYGRSRSRRRLEDDRYNDRYDNYDTHGYMTPPPNEPAYANNNNYPSSNYFPPPPTGDHAPAPGQEGYNPYPPYNPAEFNGAAAAGANREVDPATEASIARERQQDREEHRGRDAGNVSSSITSEDRACMSSDIAWTEPSSINQKKSADSRIRADGINNSSEEEHGARGGSATPRARSTSRVRFDLNSNVAHSPDERSHRPSTSTDSKDDSRDEERRYHDESRRGRRPRTHRPSSTLMNDLHERRRDSDSDDTIDLPDRFDQHGNRKADNGNDLATQLQALFGGSAHSDRHDARSRSDGNGANDGLGEVLRGLAGELFHGNNDDERSGRRSRR